MMKMATGDDSPLRRGAGTGSRLVFGGYRGSWRRNSGSILLPKVFRVYGNIWEEEVRRWTSGLSTRQEGAPPTLVGSLGLSWSNSDTPWASSGPKISSVKFQVNWRYIGGRRTSGEPRGWRACPGGWARPPPSWAAWDSPGPSLILCGLLLVQK